ncbi:hypothetical protein [Sphingomonas alba]|uniref:Uncharacterized protein n=1 Tax=Sphingomonas alba TaxID=2908208 RepID=A0ABT0RPI8_9SPHN|nr:hypothetical protein [Sphingomonas alba]MCL6684478.1 hypothetical protein [Sphingomonas alba]
MTIRLELAPTATFPQGSASRAYLLRVPVRDDGRIDAAALGRSPLRATARRFWSPEPDKFGNVENDNGLWVLRWKGSANESCGAIESGPFRLDSQIAVSEADGTMNEFRVASMRAIGWAASAKS